MTAIDRFIRVRLWRYLMDDPVRRRSSALIASQAISATTAFAFWLLCAHLYDPKTVGLAISTVSLSSLVASFTGLGLPTAVLRYAPSVSRPAGFIGTALGLVTVASLLGGLSALLVVAHWVHSLSSVLQSWVPSMVFVGLVLGLTLSGVTDAILLSSGYSGSVLVKTVLISVPRLSLPLLGLAFGVLGIVISYGLTFIVGITFAMLLVIHRFGLRSIAEGQIAQIRAHHKFIASNYIGGLFGVLPVTFIPILVLNGLGAKAAAFSYIPLQIGGFLAVIPSSVSQSLLTVASSAETREQEVLLFRQALRHSIRLVLVAIPALTLVGTLTLRLYGIQYYHNGLLILLCVAASGYFVVINWLGDTWLNIRMRAELYLLMNILNAGAVVLGVLIMMRFGIVGVGLGWLIGQALSGLIYLTAFTRQGLVGWDAASRKKRV